MNEVDETDRPVLDRLRCAASEKDLLDLSGPCVKLGTELYALLDEVFLPICEHLADHLPCDVGQSILDKVMRHICVLLINGYLEGQLVEFMSIP